jgi:N-dimethylarginine dimethylaminohydrolase
MSEPAQYLMCPPSTFSAKVPNNIFMEELPDNLRVVDKNKALSQWLKLYKYVSSCKPVNLLPAIGDNQDLVFCSNIGVNLDSHPNSIVISNFRSDPRRGETPIGLNFFSSLGYDTEVCPYWFEGKADLHKINKNTYIGAYGIRTCLEALKWFEEEFGVEVIPIKLTNPYLYHLDCSAFPIDNQNLLLVVDELDKAIISRIEKITNIIPVPLTLGVAGTTNAIRIEDTILIDFNSSTYKNKVSFWEDICGKMNLKLKLFNLSEYEKGGGALSCLVMPLFKSIV